MNCGVEAVINLPPLCFTDELVWAHENIISSPTLRPFSYFGKAHVDIIKPHAAGVGWPDPSMFFSTPVVSFLYRTFWIVLLAMSNICDILLNDFPSFIYSSLHADLFLLTTNVLYTCKPNDKTSSSTCHLFFVSEDTTFKWSDNRKSWCLRYQASTSRK